MSESYYIGYHTGYQDGWNDAINSTPNDTALLRQALEALEKTRCNSRYEQDCDVCNAIDALKERLK